MQNNTTRLSPGRKTLLALAVASSLINGMAVADQTIIVDTPEGVTWSAGNLTINQDVTVGDYQHYYGVTMLGTVNTLTNNGTVTGSSGGIYNNGGIIDAIDNRGQIHGDYNGIFNDGTIDTLNNTLGGTISSNNIGIYNASFINTLNNSGLIMGNDTGLYNDSTIDTLNNTLGSIISGDTFGISNDGLINTLNNSGSITGSSYTGLYNNGTLNTLNNSGSITGSDTGLENGGTLDTLNNSGSITGGAIGLANYYPGSIGALNNSGTIQGQTAIYTTGSIGTITNSGIIAGTVHNESSNDLVINGGSGPAVGTLTGSSGGLTQQDVGLIESLHNVQFNAGKLLLNDDITSIVVNNPAFMPSNSGALTVANNGARLQINNTINITGNYTQAAGGSLIFGVADTAKATSDTATDQGYGVLKVSGSVNLASGSTVGLTKTGSTYGFAQGQRYLVIEASDGAHSQFNEDALKYELAAKGLALSGENVALTNTPGGKGLLLTVIGNDAGNGGDGGDGGDTGNGGNGGNGGDTGNGGNGGNGGDTGNGGNGGNEAINGATARNARNSLNGLFTYRGTDPQLMNLARAGAALGSDGDKGGARLSPAATSTAASTASVFSTQKVVDITSAHQDQLRTAQTGSGIATGENGNASGLWGQAFGGSSRQDERENVAGYHANYSGLLLGADAELNDSWRAGGLFSYTNTSVRNDGANKGSSADIDSYGLIGYATYTANPWYVNLSAGAIQHQYDTKREISLTGFDGSAKGNYNGMQYLAAVQAGYPIDLGSKTTLAPIVGLAYSTLKQDSYTEKGGNGAGLHVKADDIDSLKSDLGARLERSFSTAYGELMPSAQLTWRHEFRKEGLRSVANFSADVAGETSFATQGPSAISDTGVLTLGTTLIRNNSLSLMAKYTLEAGSGYTANTGNVQARWDF